MKLAGSIRDTPPLPAGRGTAASIPERLLSAIARTTERWLGGKHFRLKATAAAILLSLLVSLPPYSTNVRLIQSGAGAMQAIRWKVQHPLTPFPAELKDPSYGAVLPGTASHINKLELRLTWPILGWLSGTGPWTVLVWNHLAGIGAFYLLASLAVEALADTVGSALFAMGLGATFFGAWFSHDPGFGDGIAWFFMLLSLACRQPLLAGASFVAAAFCDERCVMAAPLLLLYLVVRYQQDDQKAQRNRLLLAIVGGALAWFLLRWWLARTFGLSTGTTGLGSASIIATNLRTGLRPLLEVFKASWILIPLALFTLWSRRKWVSAVTLLAAFGVALAPAFLVLDFQRSVGYTFVALLIALHFLWRDQEISRKWLAAILVVNVLFTPPGGSILRLAKSL